MTQQNPPESPSPQNPASTDTPAQTQKQYPSLPAAFFHIPETQDAFFTDEELFVDDDVFFVDDGDGKCRMVKEGNEERGNADEEPRDDAHDGMNGSEARNGVQEIPALPVKDAMADDVEESRESKLSTPPLTHDQHMPPSSLSTSQKSERMRQLVYAIHALNDSPSSETEEDSQDWANNVPLHVRQNVQELATKVGMRMGRLVPKDIEVPLPVRSGTPDKQMPAPAKIHSSVTNSTPTTTQNITSSLSTNSSSTSSSTQITAISSLPAPSPPKHFQLAKIPAAARQQLSPLLFDPIRRSIDVSTSENMNFLQNLFSSTPSKSQPDSTPSSTPRASTPPQGTSPATMPINESTTVPVQFIHHIVTEKSRNTHYEPHFSPELLQPKKFFFKRMDSDQDEPFYQFTDLKNRMRCRFFEPNTEGRISKVERTPEVERGWLSLIDFDVDYAHSEYVLHIFRETIYSDTKQAPIETFTDINSIVKHSPAGWTAPFQPESSHRLKDDDVAMADDEASKLQGAGFFVPPTQEFIPETQRPGAFIGESQRVGQQQIPTTPPQAPAHDDQMEDEESSLEEVSESSSAPSPQHKRSDAAGDDVSEDLFEEDGNDDDDDHEESDSEAPAFADDNVIPPTQIAPSNMHQIDENGDMADSYEARREQDETSTVSNHSPSPELDGEEEEEEDQPSLRRNRQAPASSTRSSIPDALPVNDLPSLSPSAGSTRQSIEREHIPSSARQKRRQSYSESSAEEHDSEELFNDDVFTMSKKRTIIKKRKRIPDKTQTSRKRRGIVLRPQESDTEDSSLNKLLDTSSSAKLSRAKSPTKYLFKDIDEQSSSRSRAPDQQLTNLEAQKHAEERSIKKTIIKSRSQRSQPSERSEERRRRTAVDEIEPTPLIEEIEPTPRRRSKGIISAKGTNSSSKQIQQTTIQWAPRQTPQRQTPPQQRDITPAGRREARSNDDFASRVDDFISQMRRVLQHKTFDDQLRLVSRR